MDPFPVADTFRSPRNELTRMTQAPSLSSTYVAGRPPDHPVNGVVFPPIDVTRDLLVTSWVSPTVSTTIWIAGCENAFRTAEHHPVKRKRSYSVHPIAAHCGALSTNKWLTARRGVERRGRWSKERSRWVHHQECAACRIHRDRWD